MELKARKSAKKTKISTLLDPESVGILIDLFFERLLLLPNSDAVTEAACSQDLKIRMRAQFVMLLYARSNIPDNSTRLLSKHSYSTYLATCIGYAQLQGMSLESIVLPFDHKIWDRLYREFIKMLASIHLKKMLKNTSRKLKEKADLGAKLPKEFIMGFDLLKKRIKPKNKLRIPNSTDNYAFAKETLPKRFQTIDLESKSLFPGIPVFDFMNEFKKINTVGKLDTMREYYQRHKKNWYFYDFPEFKPKLAEK